MPIDLNQKIYVASHRGMVGSVIVRTPKEKGYQHIVIRAHSKIDLNNQAAVQEFFVNENLGQGVFCRCKSGRYLCQ